MRIISGAFKGRKFTPPTNITARPTTDFAKESLFNVLNNRFEWESISALDLFAGTGSISYELVSRGVPNVTAVEMSERHLTFIHHVIQELNMKSALYPVRMDVFRYVKSARHAQFDIIFADPPYAMNELPALPDLIFQNNILKEGGLFILEHSRKNHFESHPNFMEERSYGNVHFSFFEKKD
ncbi:16S rRNA (guanine(966)-N(2))-methyltransferase RsmD [Microbacter margulisiae]|uniref:16S rRNA (Guanine(966)-N(2))-methyltransferase RsmD n=1 Tax=Microbacter margulisiae TaxID=1350067 RepID=A0A7W5DP46_9PORP|nr:16S rRNA (guanine(966)-N(2))-methyltransferase RsmD [Microbacter margulisiae]MBB3186412.1 16S rRNA (guanine(966)-N(2))-methyltransferase RsmD [Microbacter margulisiae]